MFIYFFFFFFNQIPWSYKIIQQSIYFTFISASKTLSLKINITPGRNRVAGFRLLGYVLQEVLLNPHRLLLLLQDSLFDDLDELLCPRPGVRLQAGVETGNGLQLLLLRPAHPNKILLRLHAHRQLPARTGNRKEAVLWWWVWWCLEPVLSRLFAAVVCIVTRREMMRLNLNVNRQR